MNYLVLELHGGLDYAAIVTNEDGENKVFDNLEAAQKEAADCQDGIIVPLYDTGELPQKPKVLIEVEGGLVQGITTNTENIEVFVHDNDNDPDERFTYWKSDGDKQLSDEDFEKEIIKLGDDIDDRSDFDKMENAPYEDS